MLIIYMYNLYMYYNILNISYCTVLKYAFDQIVMSKLSVTLFL